MPIYEYECKACHERFEALVYASTKRDRPASRNRATASRCRSASISSVVSLPPVLLRTSYNFV